MMAEAKTTELPYFPVLSPQIQSFWKVNFEINVRIQSDSENNAQSWNFSFEVNTESLNQTSSQFNLWGLHCVWGFLPEA